MIFMNFSLKELQASVDRVQEIEYALAEANTETAFAIDVVEALLAQEGDPAEPEVTENGKSHEAARKLNAHNETSAREDGDQGTYEIFDL